jgi:hypothetical protein
MSIMLVEGSSYEPPFIVVMQGEGIEKKYVHGVTRTVTLTDEVGREVFRRTFSRNSEFQEFIRDYIISFPGYSPGLALLVPPRTQTWNELAQDVLFPTVVNHAFKQPGLVKMVAGTVAGLAIDLFTMIPRVVATPFRIYSNQNTPTTQHPLYQLLKDNPAATCALESGYLMAQMSLEVIFIEERKCSEMGSMFFYAFEDIVKVTKPILTNPNSPCPIQEVMEIERKRTDFQGKVRISDRRAFVTKCPTQANAKSTTTYHLIDGLEEEPIHYHRYFTDD